jgi:hypothetical protein
MKYILLINILEKKKLKSFTDIIQNLYVLYKCNVELFSFYQLKEQLQKSFHADQPNGKLISVFQK